MSMSYPHDDEESECDVEVVVRPLPVPYDGLVPYVLLHARRPRDITEQHVHRLPVS